MTTYALVIEQAATGLREVKACSTAANAIDELEFWRASGATVPVILRNEQAISEAALRGEEAVRAIDVEQLGSMSSAAAESISEAQMPKAAAA